ncbi:hypothetical protein V8C44DRAFT_143190 [Trichoderma aethiopicum]
MASSPTCFLLSLLWKPKSWCMSVRAEDDSDSIQAVPLMFEIHSVSRPTACKRSRQHIIGRRCTCASTVGDRDRPSNGRLESSFRECNVHEPCRPGVCGSGSVTMNQGQPSGISTNLRTVTRSSTARGEKPGKYIQLFTNFACYQSNAQLVLYNGSQQLRVLGEAKHCAPLPHFVYILLPPQPPRGQPWQSSQTGTYQSPGNGTRVSAY